MELRGNGTVSEHWAAWEASVARRAPQQRFLGRPGRIIPLPAAAIDLCHCPGREITGLIAGGDDPQGMVLTRAKLRDIVAVRNERLGEVLESLERAGRLSRTAAGWQQLE
jgi:hypothetical protein